MIISGRKGVSNGASCMHATACANELLYLEYLSVYSCCVTRQEPIQTAI